MSYQDPNQQPNQYGAYNPNPEPQPQPTDPYSGNQYGQNQNPQGGQYGQPNMQNPYGQPGGQGYANQPPYGAQQGAYGNAYNDPQNPMTALNMKQNTAAGVSYIFGTVVGLIFFLVEKQNRFVRFHAIQSFIYCTAYIVLAIILNSVYNATGILAISCLTGLVGLAAFVGWLLCFINALQGKYFKLPVIGDYAERFANQTPGAPTAGPGAGTF